MADQTTNATNASCKAKLTAAGCPAHAADQLTTHLAGAGAASADQVAHLAATVPGFNWALLVPLILKYGPEIVTDIAALFGGGGGATPAPTPAP